MDVALGNGIKFTIIAAGIAVGFVREKKLSRSNHLFWVFLIVAAGCETLDISLGRYYGSNYVFYHVCRPMNYCLLTLGLSYEIGRARRFFLFTIPVVVLLAILNAYYLQAPDKDLNTNIIVLTSLLLILQVLFFIARLFEEANRQEMMYGHSFWIGLGIMVVSITSFLTLGLYNVIQVDGQAMIITYLIISEWVFYGSFVLNFLVQKDNTALPER